MLSLRPICQITITQQPVTDWPSRNLQFSFNFINDLETGSNWEDLTNTAKLIFPKKLYFIDQYGKRVTWFGKNLTAGSSTPPIILRGDKVKIECGYKYQDDSGNEVKEINELFSGFISRINNRMPVEIECEDTMYLFKQISTPNKTYVAAPNNLQTMLTEMLDLCNKQFGTSFVAVTTDPGNPNIQTNIGNFQIHNETLAQILKRLQKDLRIESYVRGNELRCSGVVYYPKDRNEYVFGFQENIVSDELEYRRLDDLSFGVKAYSINEVQQTTLTSSGQKRKKKSRLSAFITKDSKGNVKEIPESGFEGEKRTLYIPNVSNKDELILKAGQQMNRLYYEGYKGNITTFGLPYVRHGDSVYLRDKILPERTGTYMVKGVTYRFGYETGFRQDVHLDIRIDTLPSDLLAMGM